MLYVLFFALLLAGFLLLLAFIFIQREQANLLLFLLFALLTIMTNALFMLSLQNHEQQLQVVAYITGGFAIGTTMLRVIAPKTDLLCKICIALLFAFSLFGAFFL